MRWILLLALMSPLTAQTPAPVVPAPKAATPSIPVAAPIADGVLAARIRTLEDREEIQRVLLNYGRFLDARRLADYAALFAKDGEWTGGFGTVKTPKAIQDFMEKNIGTGANTTRTYHLLSNFIIDVKGDEATAWSRWAFVTPTPDQKPSLAQGGHYEDRLVREDGKWKFKQRIAFTDIPFNDPTSKK